MKNILIAIRNLNRQKKRSFLLGGAIAFGIMIITIINGFTGSFVENLSENFSYLFGGHIFIEGVEKLDSGRQVSIIPDGDLLRSTIEQTKIPVTHIGGTSGFQATLIFQNNNASQQVVGVNMDSNLIRDRLNLTKGSFDNMKDPHGIIVSDKVADKIKAQVGDTILAQMHTATGQLNVGEFKVAAISYDPGLFGSIVAYANLAYVNELLNIGPTDFQTMGILLPNMQTMDADAAKIYKALSSKVSMFERNTESSSQNPYTAMVRQAKNENWKGVRYRLSTMNDRLAQVKQAAGAVNWAGFILLLILFIIIMVGITNTFRMIMYERIKEIGTMRALGMQRSQVRNLFMLEAFFLGVGGIAAGFALAAIIMGLLHLINFGIGSPLALFLKNGHMTFAPSGVWVAGYTIGVALLTLLAAFFPARSAAKLNPADALRATH